MNMKRNMCIISLFLLPVGLWPADSTASLSQMAAEGAQIVTQGAVKGAASGAAAALENVKLAGAPAWYESLTQGVCSLTTQACAAAAPVAKEVGTTARFIQSWGPGPLLAATGIAAAIGTSYMAYPWVVRPINVIACGITCGVPTAMYSVAAPTIALVATPFELVNKQVATLYGAPVNRSRWQGVSTIWNRTLNSINDQIRRFQEDLQANINRTTPDTVTVVSAAAIGLWLAAKAYFAFLGQPQADAAAVTPIVGDGGLAGIVETLG